MAVRTHTDIDGNAAVLAVIATLQAVVLAAIAVLQAIVNAIQIDVTNILAVTNALPILEETGGTFTTDGTEQNLYINNSPTGVYRPVSLNINLSNHTAADTIQIRTLVRNAAGGALVQRDILSLAGALDSDSVDIDLPPSRFGIQITAQLTAGTNYALTWEVFYEVAP